MTLLDEAMEQYVIINKITSNDGYGGIETQWIDGAVIDAAVVLDTSMQSRIGQKLGVTAIYTVTTKKNINLQFHDVLRRVSDNKIFRVTSDGDDRKTPNSASLNMRQVSAEEWVLPSD